jgi:hypothetical protein
LSEAAEAWDRTKDATSVAVLEAFIARYAETFYADLARARIEELRKQRPSAAGSPTKLGQPTTVTGRLRCDTYTNRSDCDAQTLCAWVGDTRQWSTKSGAWRPPCSKLRPCRNPNLRRAPPPLRSRLDTRSKGLPASAVRRWQATRSALMPPSQDPAVESCARLCDSHLGCSIFDISVVYSKCTL